MQDQLTAEAIQKHLQTRCIGQQIVILPTTDSTNTQMKQQFSQNPEGFVLCAEQQTAGRGRLGRSFVSPPGSGLYFSLLLHPNLPLGHMSALTPIAAVTVCRAIEQLCRLHPQIKWVNDVFLDDKKICGILTESACTAQIPDFSVIGIGLNLHFDRTAYPELAEIVGSLADQSETMPTRAQLIAAILNQFEPLYQSFLQGTTEHIMEQYRSRLNCLGKPITVKTASKQYPATCLDLTKDGNLVIQTESGEIETLQAGEISIRL